MKNLNHEAHKSQPILGIFLKPITKNIIDNLERKIIYLFKKTINIFLLMGEVDFETITKARQSFSMMLAF